MSRYLIDKYQTLEAYVPGEQPRDMQYVKLNTNENPYPPAPGVVEAVQAEAGRLQLYSDPVCVELRDALAARYGVKRQNVFVSNGSDDILNFAFMAFGSPRAYFPDISYGFYPVYAELHGIEAHPIPLRKDFSIDPTDYMALDGFIAIANPNAPTGMALGKAQIEDILCANPDHVVLIDEAYVDFGAESCVELTARYDNLLVVQTYSKSRSMAGARLGFSIANEGLIADLEKIKFSTNPYSINRMTLAAGLATLKADDYCADCCQKVIQTREKVSEELRKIGLTVLPSKANFIFVRCPGRTGKEIYTGLRTKGILVRYWDTPRIRDYVRITIGTPEQMDLLIDQLSCLYHSTGIEG